MSWPTDGKPRYLIAVTEGYLLQPRISSARNESHRRTNPNATYAILDRAYCHRAVKLFRSEDFGSNGGILRARAKAQCAAEEFLASLTESLVAA